MKMDNKNTYAGPVTRDGKKLEEIALKPTLTMEADPNAPAAMKIADQNNKGAAYFDNAAGRLVEMDLKQNMTMEINAGGQMITQKMEQTVTMKLAGSGK